MDDSYWDDIDTMLEEYGELHTQGVPCTYASTMMTDNQDGMNNFSGSYIFTDKNSSPCVEPTGSIDFSSLNFNESATQYEMSGPEAFYAILIPIIITVGLVGNVLSLMVFLSNGMRKQSASYYLVAIAISDMIVLLVFVLVQWIKHGLTSLSNSEGVIQVKEALELDGVCQIHLYLAYFARFLSVWLIVVFTCERYVGVCHPFKKLEICTSSWSRKIIGSLIVISLLVAIYKPILNGNEVIDSVRDIRACTTKRQYEHVAYILDAVYGGMITIIPCVIIFVLNTLMAHKLCLRNQTQKRAKHVSPDSNIKLEFTFILLALSTTFLVLNIPFFVVWCIKYANENSMTVNKTISLLEHNNRAKTLDDFLHVTKPIFYINYCINFFLYSVTGAYFRRELKMMCVIRQKQSGLHRRLTWTQSYSSNLTTQTNTHHTWV